MICRQHIIGRSPILGVRRGWRMDVQVAVAGRFIAVKNEYFALNLRIWFVLLRNAQTGC